MAEVTEADQEKARECIGNGNYYDEERERIAAALAEEREKARAPFLALAEAMERDVRTIWSDKIAEKIRHAAEES